MTKSLAWDIMQKVVWPKVAELKLKEERPMTIDSNLDMEDGVALITSRGTVHVLGTGEIVDEDDVLGYKRLERDIVEYKNYMSNQ